MATKDISDLQVLRAYVKSRKDSLPENRPVNWPYDILMQETGQPEKVCLSAMSRACKRGLVDYGVSLRSGFLTPEGRELLEEAGPCGS